MNKIRLLLMLLIGILFSIQAQTSKRDFYEGLTKKISYDKMIAPYGMEVTFDKTVHIIFQQLSSTLTWVPRISLQEKLMERRMLFG